MVGALFKEQLRTKPLEGFARHWYLVLPGVAVLRLKAFFEIGCHLCKISSFLPVGITAPGNLPERNPCGILKLTICVHISHLFSQKGVFISTIPDAKEA
jgi:hypothetical protein